MEEEESRGNARRNAAADRIDAYLRAAVVAGAVLLIVSQLLLRVPAIRTVLVPHERVEGIPYGAG